MAIFKKGINGAFSGTIGNYHTETAGCPLTGSYWQRLDGDYQVIHSAAAYKYVYPLLVEQISKKNDRIIVENRV